MFKDYFETASKSHRNTFLALALLNLFTVNFLSVLSQESFEKSMLAKNFSQVQALRRQYTEYMQTLYRLRIHTSSSEYFFRFHSPSVDIEIPSPGRAEFGQIKPNPIYSFSPLLVVNNTEASINFFKGKSYSIDPEPSSKAKKVSLINIIINTIEKEDEFTQKVDLTNLQENLVEFVKELNTSPLYKKRKHGIDLDPDELLRSNTHDPFHFIGVLTIPQLESFENFLKLKLSSQKTEFQSKMPIANIEIDATFLRFILPLFILLLIVVTIYYQEQIHTIIKKTDSEEEFHELAKHMDFHPWLLGKIYVANSVELFLASFIYFISGLVTVTTVFYSLFIEFSYFYKFSLLAILANLAIIILLLTISVRIYHFRSILDWNRKESNLSYSILVE